MDRNVRKAALRAAAKTAIALSLTGAHLLSSGCAELHRSSPREPDASARLDAAARLDANLGIDAMQMSMPDAPSLDAGPLDCDEYLASLDLVESPDVWPSPLFHERNRLDPRTGECCLEIDRRVINGEPSGVSAGLEMACCETIVYAQNLVPFSRLGCTPWGPPCPPAMPQPHQSIGTLGTVTMRARSSLS